MTYFENVGFNSVEDFGRRKNPNTCLIQPIVLNPFLYFSTYSNRGQSLIEMNLFLHKEKICESKFAWMTA